MSTGALLLAVRDRLRDTLDQTPHLNNKSSIDIMPDSKPKADCGQTFLSIYSESWSNPNTQAQGALEERMDVVVAISQRTPETPQDRFGSLYAGVTLSMTNLAYKIAISLHQWEGIYAAADAYLADFEQTTTDASTFEGFFEHLRWGRTDAMPQPVGYDHYVQDPMSNINADHYENYQSGFLMKVGFVEARRMTKQSNFASLLG